MSAPLTVEDVRAYLIDQQIRDNDLDLDLSFSDEQIIAAMTRAARAFNSLKPFSMTVATHSLPGDTNVFLDATLEQLYISEIQQLRREDIDYTAGGVQANMVRTRIGHLTKSIEECKARWMSTATDIKLVANLNKCNVIF